MSMTNLSHQGQQTSAQGGVQAIARLPSNLLGDPLRVAEVLVVKWYMICRLAFISFLFVYWYRLRSNVALALIEQPLCLPNVKVMVSCRLLYSSLLYGSLAPFVLKAIP
ncbi:hypothetical protein OK016_19925 [Vibrio chagasii]|nr:hypothetical protein [Vibrio chagasii]